ncbi:MAG: ABC transporter substrate-binding protein [Candidatus Dormibacterales bacterium]
MAEASGRPAIKLPGVLRSPAVGGFALMALGAASCGGAAAPSGSSGPSGTVNVGLLAEFSGARASLGPAKLQGLQLAAQQIEAAGGCDGHHINIDEVDGPDPVDTATGLRKALASDNLSLVIGPDVNSYQTALPIMEQAKMVNFTYIGTPGVYSAQHWAYSFRSGPSDAFVGAAMVYAAHLKGYQKIAIALSSDQGSQDLVPSMKAMAEHEGMTIVANVSVPINVTSYAGYVADVVNSHPDGVLFQMTTASDAGAWSGAWQHQGGAGIPLIGSDFTATGQYVQALGASFAEAHLTSAIPALAVNDAAGTAFLSDFKAKFGATPAVYAPHFFDSLVVACLAMDQAHSTDPSVYVKDVTNVTDPAAGHTAVYSYADGYKLIKEGKQIKYYGVGGPMTFTPSHSVTGPYQVVRTDAQGNTTVLANITAQALAPGIGPGTE